MIFQIDTSKGWTEAIIDDDCEFTVFEKTATILRDKLNIVFSNQTNDLETYYLDFMYEGTLICLHYNIFVGLSMFANHPDKEPTTIDNENVVKIFNLVKHQFENYNWQPFDNSKSIGKVGSEGGKIVDDLENIEGARITLEKNCGNIPFAVTIGIYGLMFHTHFDSKLESVNLFIENSKIKINKVFEMYNIAEKERTEFWQSKHDKLIEELAEMTNP